MPEMNNRADYAARAARALKSAETATDAEMAAVYRNVAESYAELVRLMPSERPAQRAI